MMSLKPLHDSDCSEFVEVDPTGRYGRYNEILGKGSSKTVYRAFDEYQGIEVAWNQVKLYDFLQSPEDLERLYCEIHLLKTLKHKNIMKFYTSWVDVPNRKINFVTEMFTSGTLRQYRQKHRKVNIRALKHWCRQILTGLLYLHSHDLPIIHRDLKCDNIFINGNQGEVKIGDLGLAAILRNSHAVHCVGTPEFMAPEVYQEEYNELVDIYSFGMCVLEMVTFEYPYSECDHPVQIYKKVVSGTKPEALYRVKDPEMRQFVEKCLVSASRRLPASELLKDPFLQIDDAPMSCCLISNGGLVHNELPDDSLHKTKIENGWDSHAADVETHGIELFHGQEDEAFADVDITIKGRTREDGSIYLRLRIADKEGRVRNIYFPFDIEADTALIVATEMVAELDITDHDVTRIADMIDGEVSSLVPHWKPGTGIEDVSGFPSTSICLNCASNVSSNDSLLDYLTTDNPCSAQSARCSHLGCAMRGRFGEYTYQDEGSEHCVTEGAPGGSTSQSDAADWCSEASRESHLDEESYLLRDEKVIPSRQSQLDEACVTSFSNRLHSEPIQEQHLKMHEHLSECISEDYEHVIRQELGWLKAKDQRELAKSDGRHLGVSRSLNSSPKFDNRRNSLKNGIAGSLAHSLPQEPKNKIMRSLQRMKSFHFAKNISFRVPEIISSPRSENSTYEEDEFCWSGRPGYEAQRAQQCVAHINSRAESKIMAKGFCSADLPNSLARPNPLSVDAVDA